MAIDRAAFLDKLKGGGKPAPELEIEVEGAPDDEAMGGGEMLCNALGIKKEGVDYTAIEEAVRRIVEG